MRDYLIDEHEVCKRVVMGRGLLHAEVKAGEFPRPVPKRGKKAWRSSDIDRWIATRAERALGRL